VTAQGCPRDDRIKPTPHFHVVDMAVLPEHQRRDLGDLILTALLERTRRDAPAGAYVNLIADPPGRRLYARHASPPRRRTQSAWPGRSTEGVAEPS